MVRLKALWANMHISVSTRVISLRISSQWTRQTGEPTASLAALVTVLSQNVVSATACTGTFGLFHGFFFYHSLPCNTTTQEQQRVKFNTDVERQLPRPSNIIYTFGANTKPPGAKV